ISHAPGRSGTPDDGQASSAATSVSCVNSSASVTSRSIRASDVIRRGCSMRQAARMAAWTSAAVIAAGRGLRACASGLYGLGQDGRLLVAGHLRAVTDHGAHFASAFPARHVIEMELHELLRHCQCFGLVAQLEDRIAADHFLGLHERTVSDAELAA